MTLEQQPTFAQLYLFIDKVGAGGITYDRDGVEIPAAIIGVNKPVTQTSVI